MPRVAKTNDDGQAVFVTDEIGLPVTDVTSRSISETLSSIEKQLNLLNLRFEEAFKTGITIEDISNGTD